MPAAAAAAAAAAATAAAGTASGAATAVADAAASTAASAAAAAIFACAWADHADSTAASCCQPDESWSSHGPSTAGHVHTGLAADRSHAAVLACCYDTACPAGARSRGDASATCTWLDSFGACAHSGRHHMLLIQYVRRMCV